MLTRCMALRVLLADESVTIKKVFQLALQDFAVEVTTVNVGLDVLDVARKVNPDIIFVDVLLQKKSGYEVSRDLKSDGGLAKTPVVLIWSGFMELDEARFKTSGANAHLEKPFDTQKLRKIVQDLVPKTKTQTLSGFLEFPKLPDFDEPQMKTPPPSAPELEPIDLNGPSPGAPSTGSWSMESFSPIAPAPVEDEDADEFFTVELPTAPPQPTSPKSQPLVAESKSEDDESQWVQKTLSKYKLDLQKSLEDLPQKDDSRIEFPNKSPIEEEPELELDLSEQGEYDFPPPVTKVTKVTKESLSPQGSAPASINPPAIPQFSEEQLEAIIRAQSQETIEKVVWQIVPEIATRIIEREIERLLKEQKSL